jgi:hypothetical protein
MVCADARRVVVEHWCTVVDLKKVVSGDIPNHPFLP